MNSKLYKQDYKRDIGTLGIKLPMNARNSEANNTFDMSYYTEEQAVSNMINLLLTDPYERFMQPEFGVGLRRYIFENSVDEVISQLESNINAQIQMWLPYIKLIDLEVASNDDHGIGIKITFSVFNSSANHTITIFNINSRPTVSYETN